MAGDAYIDQAYAEAIKNASIKHVPKSSSENKSKTNSATNSAPKSRDDRQKGGEATAPKTSDQFKTIDAYITYLNSLPNNGKGTQVSDALKAERDRLRAQTPTLESLDKGLGLIEKAEDIGDTVAGSIFGGIYGAARGIKDYSAARRAGQDARIGDIFASTAAGAQAGSAAFQGGTPLNPVTNAARGIRTDLGLTRENLISPEEQQQLDRIYGIRRGITSAERVENVARTAREIAEYERGAAGASDFAKYAQQGLAITDADFDRGYYSDSMSNPFNTGEGMLGYAAASSRAFERNLANPATYALRHADELLTADLNGTHETYGISDTGYLYMTENEVAVYSYYAAKEGRKAADKYYKALLPQLEERRAEHQYAGWREWAAEHPGLASVVSVGSNFGSVGSFLNTAATAMTQGYDAPVNPYAPITEAARMTSALREGAQEEYSARLVDSSGGEYLRKQGMNDDQINQLGSFLYGTGMSMADCAVQMALLGLPVGENASLLAMSASAAGTQAQESAEAGIGAGDAAAMATIAGGVEFLTEKVSLDNLIKVAKGSGGSKRAIVNAIGGFFSQMGAEGSEELTSSYLDTLADIAINGDMSQYEQFVSNCMAQGMSREDAENAANFQFFFAQPMQDAAGGALSGAGFGVIGGTVGAGRNVYNGSRISAADAAAMAQATGDVGLMESANALAGADRTTAYQRGRLMNQTAEYVQNLPKAERTAVQQKIDVVAALLSKSSEGGLTDGESLALQILTGQKAEQSELSRLRDTGSVRDVQTFEQLTGISLNQNISTLTAEADTVADASAKNADVVVQGAQSQIEQLDFAAQQQNDAVFEGLNAPAVQNTFDYSADSAPVAQGTEAVIRQAAQNLESRTVGAGIDYSTENLSENAKTALSRAEAAYKATGITGDISGNKAADIYKAAAVQLAQYVRDSKGFTALKKYAADKGITVRSLIKKSLSNGFISTGNAQGSISGRQAQAASELAKLTGLKTRRQERARFLAENTNTAQTSADDNIGTFDKENPDIRFMAAKPAPAATIADRLRSGSYAQSTLNALAEQVRAHMDGFTLDTSASLEEQRADLADALDMIAETNPDATFTPGKTAKTETAEKPAKKTSKKAKKAEPKAEIYNALERDMAMYFDGTEEVKVDGKKGGINVISIATFLAEHRNDAGYAELKKTVDTAQSIASAVGSELVVTDGTVRYATGSSQSFKGLYVNGKIYVNAADLSTAGMRIIGHEVGHEVAAHDPKLLRQFHDLCVDYARKNGTMDEFNAKLNDIYENSVFGNDEYGLFEEYFADRFGDLFTDEDFARYAAGEKPSLVRRIVAAIKRVLAKIINNKDSREYLQLEQTRDLFLAALEDIRVETEEARDNAPMTLERGAREAIFGTEESKGRTLPRSITRSAEQARAKADALKGKYAVRSAKGATVDEWSNEPLDVLNSPVTESIARVPNENNTYGYRTVKMSGTEYNLFAVNPDVQFKQENFREKYGANVNAARSIAGAFGVKLGFYAGSSLRYDSDLAKERSISFDSMISDDGTVWINLDAKHPYSTLVGAAYWQSVQKNNPKAAREIMRQLRRIKNLSPETYSRLSPGNRVVLDENTVGSRFTNRALTTDRVSVNVSQRSTSVAAALALKNPSSLLRALSTTSPELAAALKRESPTAVRTLIDAIGDAVAKSEKTKASRATRALRQAEARLLYEFSKSAEAARSLDKNTPPTGGNPQTIKGKGRFLSAGQQAKTANVSKRWIANQYLVPGFALSNELRRGAYNQYELEVIASLFDFTREISPRGKTVRQFSRMLAKAIDENMVAGTQYGYLLDKTFDVSGRPINHENNWNTVRDRTQPTPAELDSKIDMNEWQVTEQQRDLKVAEQLRDLDFAIRERINEEYLRTLPGHDAEMLTLSDVSEALEDGLYSHRQLTEIASDMGVETEGKTDAELTDDILEEMPVSVLDDEAAAETEPREYAPTKEQRIAAENRALIRDAGTPDEAYTAFYPRVNKKGLSKQVITVHDKGTGKASSRTSYDLVEADEAYMQDFVSRDLVLAREYRKANRAARALKLPVHWYVGEVTIDRYGQDRTTRAVNANGFMLNGEIWLNAAAIDRAYTQTIGHELLHLAAKNDSSDAIVSKLYALYRIEMNRHNREAEFDAELEQIAQSYGYDITHASGRQTAFEEMLADKYGEIFADEKYLRRLVQSRDGIFGKLRAAISNLMDRLKQGGVKDLSMLERIDLAMRGVAESYLGNGDIRALSARAEVRQKGTPRLQAVVEKTDDLIFDHRIRSGDILDRLSKYEEQKKRGKLVATHNTNAANLTKSIELGGLPSPSIAVYNPDGYHHNNFGDITLVFGADTIDPESDGGQVFAGDAWTPIVSYAVERLTERMPARSDFSLEEIVEEMNRMPASHLPNGDTAARLLSSMSEIRALASERYKFLPNHTDSNIAEIVGRLDAISDLIGDNYLSKEGGYASSVIRANPALRKMANMTKPNEKNGLDFDIDDKPDYSDFMEAKPRRAVTFDEVLYAIVPQRETEVVNSLRAIGVNVRTYDDERMTRSRVINSLEDAKFSLPRGSRPTTSSTRSISEAQQEVRDTYRRREVRQRIGKAVRELSAKLITPTDEKHIPDNLREAVADFLKVFTQDSSVFKADRLLMLKAAYDSISEEGANGDADIATAYDPDISAEIGELAETIGGRRLAQLSLDETESVWHIVANMKHIVNTANKLYLAGKQQSVSALGAQAMGELGMIELDGKHRAPRAQTGYAGMDSFKSLLASKNITPPYFFKRLGGVFEKAFGDIKAGEGKWARNMQAARDFYEKTYQQFHVGDWLDKRGDVLTMTTDRGDDITLNRQQAMTLYATYMREIVNRVQDAGHIRMGGFVYQEADTLRDRVRARRNGTANVDTTKAHPLSDADMRKIMDWLTPEQRRFTDTMVRYLSNDMSQLGNETSTALHGYKKFNESYYFPYQSSGNYLYTRMAVGEDSRIKHAGFTRALTTKANNPIVLTNFLDTWGDHVQRMCLYNALAVPLENFNRIWNFRTSVTDSATSTSVKQMLEKAYGKDANSYIKQLLTDLNGGVGASSAEDFTSVMLGKMKKGAVFASASVVVQQPSAIMRAMAMIDPRHFIATALTKRTWDECKKYCSAAIIKSMGRFDTGVGRGATEWLIAPTYKGAQKVTAALTDSAYRDELLSVGAEKADEMTWAHIWNACKHETAERTKFRIGSPEFYEAAAKRFDDVVSFTQVYDSTLVRSELMRSKSQAAKVLTNFMAEPTVSYNMLLDAVVNSGRNDVRNKVSIPRATAAFVSSVILNALLKSLVTAARDDDDKKTYVEKYLGELTGNALEDLDPLGLMPYVRDCLSIFKGYKVTNPAMQPVQDLYYAVKALDSDNLSFGEKSLKLAGALGTFFGLPIKNVERDVNAVVNLFRRNADAKTSKVGIIDSMLDAVPLYDNSNTANAERLYEALVKGDDRQAEWLTLMLEYGGLSDSGITSAVERNVKSDYLNGDLTYDEAMAFLTDKLTMSEDDAYWAIDEWEADMQNYTPYHHLHDALAAGDRKAAQEAINELLAHGKTAQGIKSSVQNKLGSGDVLEGYNLG